MVPFLCFEKVMFPDRVDFEPEGIYAAAMAGDFMTSRMENL
jgi:hypothetical protein